MKILVTGACGFIGFNLCVKLLEKNISIIGIDSISSIDKIRNDRLKRLKRLKKFKYINKDLSKNKNLNFKDNIKIVIHLAAKPGVRESLINPRLYFDNNLVAFFNIIEFVRSKKIKYFIYASSSSVYGNLKSNAATETLKNLNPLSFYALTKYMNEMIAKHYSEIHNIKTIGLRFFSVYGPYGRSDMAYYKFPLKLIKNKTIQLNNKGNDKRDFTYIDDVTNGIFEIIKKIKSIKKNNLILNFGSNKPIFVKEIINIIKKNFKKKIKIKFMKKNKLDPDETNADLKYTKKIIPYSINTNFRDGYQNFLNWFKAYYKIDK